MQSPHLNRVRSWRRGGARVVRWVLATLTAASLCGITLLLGVATHKLVERDANAAISPPDDLVLGWMLSDQAPLAMSAWQLQEVCLAMGALSLLLYLSWRWQAVTAQREATEAICQLRSMLYERAASPSALDILSQRSQAERLMSCSEPIRHGLIVFWQQTPRCQVSVLALLVVALLIDPWLTLLGTLLAVAGYWRFQIVSTGAEERARQLHGKVAKSESLLMESLRLAPLAASFGLAQPPGEPFQQNLRLHAVGELRGHAMRAVLGARAIGLIAVGLLVLFGVFCASGRLTLSEGVVIAAALVGASMLAIRLLTLRPLVSNADEAAEEILEYIDGAHQLPSSSSPRPLKPLQRSIRLEDVAWEDHRGRRILTNASCEIPSGELSAVLSSDESAPAAIAALVSRLHDPLEGRVLYDDEDIRGANLSDVRKEVCFVSARPLLFTGTVHDNIVCGDKRLAGQAEDAARQCGAWDMIQELPQGMSTLVGPLGLDLPTETTFLIMLVRAVLRDPSLLIVEEPSTGASILPAIEVAAKHRAVLLIPAKLESLRRAARVLLLHQGQIQCAGRHADLIKSSDLYRHLNYMRFNPYGDAAGKEISDIGSANVGT